MHFIARPTTAQAFIHGFQIRLRDLLAIYGACIGLRLPLDLHSILFPRPGQQKERLRLVIRNLLASF